MILPCPNHIDCPPDDLLTNYSSETLQLQEFFGIAFGADGCIGRCTSTISQEDADLCAQRQLVLCQTEDPEIPPPPPPPAPGTVQLGGFVAGCCIDLPFTGEIEVIGDVQELTFSISGGSLPEGVTLVSGPTSSMAIQFAGTPTTAGLYTFTVLAQNESVIGSREYSFNVIEISDESLPVYQVGTPYSHELSVEAGSGDYIWSVLSGSLPSGLSLNAGGVITGTPLESGSFPVVLGVTDLVLGVSCNKEFTVSSGFGCCQTTGQYLPPDFGAGVVVAGYIGSSFPTDNVLRVFSPECNGLLQVTGTNIVGGVLWVDSVQRFYFRVRNHGTLGDEQIGIFDPSNNSVSYIGGFSGFASSGTVPGFSTRAIWIPQTNRIWMIMSQGSTDNIAIIDPSDNSVIMLSSSLLFGIQDFTYCSSNQNVYCATTARIARVDVNTLDVNLVLDAVSLQDFYTAEYAVASDEVWIGTQTAGPGYAAYIIDPATNLLVETLASVGRAAMWYDSVSEKILSQIPNELFIRVFNLDPAFGIGTMFNDGSNRLISNGGKGAFVESLNKFVIPTTVPSVEHCLTYIDPPLNTGYKIQVYVFNPDPNCVAHGDPGLVFRRISEIDGVVVLLIATSNSAPPVQPQQFSPIPNVTMLVDDRFIDSDADSPDVIAHGTVLDIPLDIRTDHGSGCVFDHTQHYIITAAEFILECRSQRDNGTHAGTDADPFLIQLMP